MTIKYLATAALALCLPQIAQAAPITFFGEELAPGATVTGDPLTQRNLFVNTLAAGVGTESFESATLPNISFPVSSGNVTATLSGGGASIEGSPGAGRFATSGSNYVETTGGGDFVIDFSSAIAAFGFYGTDIGDINNSLWGTQSVRRAGHFCSLVSLIPSTATPLSNSSTPPVAAMCLVLMT